MTTTSLPNEQGAPGSHERIAAHFNSPTEQVLSALSQWRPDEQQHHSAVPLATSLCSAAHRASHTSIIPSMESLLNQFPLSETEGLALMCLAESLIRIPDKETRMALLHDQLKRSQWADSIDIHNALWLNSMVFGVAATEQILNITQSDIQSGFSKVLAHYGEATIDLIVSAIIQQMAFQFVMGESLEQAWSKVGAETMYSFDMLGEAALTPDDAQNYFERYKEAADFLAEKQGTAQAPTLSIKLSALHPRYEFHQEEAVFEALYDTAYSLISHAVSKGVPVTIDAEETERLEISLILFEKIRNALPVEQRAKVGLAVQAYQKRALPVLERLEVHAHESQAQIPIRLVKGAYWDREVKWSQLLGWPEFPVFTNKALTDLSYSACARKLLSNPSAFYPQFATHNPLTIASIAAEVGADFSGFEYQRLFGMGEATYSELQRQHPQAQCRVYAPVGQFKQLLPYLVRRMIENGANTSFVNQLGRDELDFDALLKDPWLALAQPNEEGVVKPAHLYGDERLNADGINIMSSRQFSVLLEQMAPFNAAEWQAGPSTVVDADTHRARETRFNPAQLSETLGRVTYATPIDIAAAVDAASDYAITWQKTEVSVRAEALRKAADLLEAHRPELFSLLMREAGKTFSNAQNELREAVDFLRYYAQQAEQLCEPIRCPGPTGEENRMLREGVGPFVCVSPWNFPLAIFTGQIAAALVSGNTVIAKPALETPLIGQRVVELMREAGIPKEALHFMPAHNRDCDDRLWSDPRIRGLAFTGSTATAQHINRALAARDAALPRIIAETGGQNAMIVDSSALLDQAVIDVVESAFDSAGQRCSAARVAYIQRDIYDSFMSLLKGRMSTLTVGNPLNPNVDIGPIISKPAQEKLQHYIDESRKACRATGKLMFQSAHLERDAGAESGGGHYIPPTVIQVDSMADIGEERFGPILHVIPYERDQLDDVVKAVNSTGYGLTFGVHTRLGERAEALVEQAQVGNAYINRNTVGAVVETQPFGGRGLSGTGPKAGGPDYLLAFMTSKTISDNIAAKGGDPQLYDRAAQQ